MDAVIGCGDGVGGALDKLERPRASFVWLLGGQLGIKRYGW